MKKVFNASLVAASLAMAFAANAATIKADPSNPLVLSAQGVEVGLVYDGAVSFDVVVTREHAATSEIVLTFSDTVDLSALADGACTGVTNGEFSCGDVTFNVGTGSFTFDDVEIDADENTISFVVNLGNALTANSAFRVTLDTTVADTTAATENVVIGGASTISYASNLAGTAIETGSGILSTTANQFSAVIGSDNLDNTIERVDRDTFTTTNDAIDQLDFEIVNDTTLLAAATFEDFNIVLTGDFDRETTPGTFDHSGKWELNDGVLVAGVAGVVGTDGDEITFAGATAAAPIAAGTDYTIDFAGAGIVIDPTSFGFTLNVEYSDGAAETANADLLANADAGDWRLDAAVINVPYLPVGYANLSPVVEISNLGSTDAEIIVEAVGKTGVEYTATLTKVAAKNAVTSIFEADLLAAFGLTKGTSNEKLSVTFIIDADADKVTLAPYYRDTTNNNRINVVSDQYKADSIR